MKEKEFLFHLVKSLNATERGYFTKYGFKNKSGGDEKIHLRLFNWLCNQAEYNEDQAKQKFFPNDPQKFRIVKHHLYSRIIAALVEYEKDSGIESVVWTNLSSAKVLIGKGLYTSAKKLATNAATEAFLAERYDLVYSSYAVIRDSHTTTLVNQETFDTFNEIEKVQKTCLVKSANILEYRSVFETFKLIESKVGNIDYMSNSYQEEINKLNELPLMANMENAITFESRCLFYICKAYYYNAKKDKHARLDNARALVEHIESHPEKMKYYESKYRTAVNQYLNSCFATSSFSDFDFYLHKLEQSSKTLNQHFGARNFLIVENLRMNRNFAEEKIKENIEVIRRFEQQLQQHEKHLPAESFLALYANAAISFFYMDAFKDSLVYINKILNNIKESRSKAVGYIARCLNLLIHFELNNTDLLHYLARTYKSEEHEVVVFVVLVTELLQEKSWKKNKEIVSKLQQGLNRLKENKTNAALLNDAYIDRWIEKKLAQV